MPQKQIFDALFNIGNLNRVHRPEKSGSPSSEGQDAVRKLQRERGAMGSFVSLRETDDKMIVDVGNSRVVGRFHW